MLIRSTAVIDGNGSVLMNLRTLSTIALEDCKNFISRRPEIYDSFDNCVPVPHCDLGRRAGNDIKNTTNCWDQSKKGMIVARW